MRFGTSSPEFRARRAAPNVVNSHGNKSHKTALQRFVSILCELTVDRESNAARGSIPRFRGLRNRLCAKCPPF